MRKTPRRPASARSGVPVWNEGSGRLFWRGQEIKRFSQQAANQRAVLRAFQEAGWDESIENPLSGEYRDRQQRLHDIIKSLNRGQGALRFHGGGTGRGVWWEPAEGH
jgi:hypothetical protein